MAKNHVRQGLTMSWVNGTGSDVNSGEVVVVSDMVGVAHVNIPDGAKGELAIDEVWELPKEAGVAIDQGDDVYWDGANTNIDKTDTNVPAGKAWEPAAADATVVQVKLNA